MPSCHYSLTWSKVKLRITLLFLDLKFTFWLDKNQNTVAVN